MHARVCVWTTSYKSEYASSYLEPWKLIHIPVGSDVTRPDTAPAATADDDKSHDDRHDGRGHRKEKSQVTVPNVPYLLLPVEIPMLYVVCLLTK